MHAPVVFTGNLDLSPFSTWRFFSHEQANVNGSDVVSVCRQPIYCFFLCSREQIRAMENRLYYSGPLILDPRPSTITKTGINPRYRYATHAM